MLDEMQRRDLAARLLEVIKKRRPLTDEKAAKFVSEFQQIDIDFTNVSSSSVRQRTSPPFEQYFFKQIRRCNFIFESYGRPGISAEVRDELVRWGIVFFHACLEDVIRQVALQTWPQWQETALKNVPLAGHPRAEKLYLSDLISFRGKAVDEVLKSAAEYYLNSQSFTSLANILSFLNSVNVSVDIPKRMKASLDEFIKRRHRIVHHSDCDRDTGTPFPIDEDDCLRWLAAVILFVTKLSHVVTGDDHESIDSLASLIFSEDGDIKEFKDSVLFIMDVLVIMVEYLRVESSDKQQACTNVMEEG